MRRSAIIVLLFAAVARTAVGTGRGVRRHRVGVAGRGSHGEVAVPGAQPPSRRPERRRRGRREPAPRRLSSHCRGGRGAGHPRGSGAGLHPQPDVRGSQRAPRRRRLPRVLGGRHHGGAGARGCPGVPSRAAPSPSPRRAGPVPDPGPDLVVYEALSPDPASLDELARATGLGLSPLCGALERLSRAGLAVGAGGWWERA